MLHLLTLFLLYSSPDLNPFYLLNPNLLLYMLDSLHSYPNLLRLLNPLLLSYLLLLNYKLLKLYLNPLLLKQNLKIQKPED